MTFLKTKTGIALVVLIALFAFLYFFTGAFGGTFIGITLRSNPDLENGLVAHYTFDGKDVDVSSTTAEIADSSGNSNDGNFVGEAFGEMLWATTTDPSTGTDEAYAITTDSSGYVYVAGYGTSISGCGGLCNYTYKIDGSNGDMLWATTTDPSAGNDYARAITTDSSGYVYVTGYGPIVGCSNNCNYTYKIDPSNGDMLWATTTDPSTSFDYARAITTDSSGYVYVTGDTDNEACGGGGIDTCNYTYKIDPSNGDMLWATTTDPSTGNDTARAITTDSSGYVYVTGYGLISGCGSYCNYTYKIDPSNGDMLWATTTDPSTGSDYARAITTDSSGYVYVTGSGSVAGCGSNCNYTYKIDPSNGDMLWATTTDPSTLSDHAYGITTDSSGYVYVTGYTTLSGSCGIGGNCAQYTYKIDGSNGDMIWATTTDPTTDFDLAYGIATDGSGNVYVTGYRYVGASDNALYTYKIRADTYAKDAVTSGNIGQGMEFDGVDDYVALSSFDPTDVGSVAFWVNVNSVTGSRDRILGGDNAFEITIEPDGSTDCDLFTGTGFDTSPFVLRTGEWQHYVCVYAASGATSKTSVFIDGVLVGSGDYTKLDPGTDVLSLGVRTGTIDYFDGSLDDVRIYDRALSTSSIERLYQLGATTKIAKTLDSNPDLQDGLVGHWTFDGPDMDIASNTAEIIDRGPNGINGDWVLHATTTVSGKIGQGIKFDGVDEYIDVGDITYSSTMTWSAWVKPNGISGDQGVMGSITNFRPELEIDNGGNVFIGNANSDWVKRTTNIIKANEWSHIVVTWSTSASSDVDIYVNGELAPVGTDYGNSLNTGTGSFTIGRAWNEYLAGAIDDVRVYDRELSASEISRLYELGATTKIAKTIDTNPDLEFGLIGHYTFDGYPDTDLSSTTAEVRDRSSYAHHGDLLGHTSVAEAFISGTLGQGMRFDGTNDSVLIEDNANISGLSALTFSFWIWWDDFDAGEYINFLSKANAASQREWRIRKNTSDQIAFMISNDGNTAGGGNSIIFPLTDAFQESEWYHIAGTYDDANGDLLELYIDGQFYTSATGESGPMFDGTAGFMIGAASEGAAPFDGRMDEVRVYNRALSAEEISRIYQLGQ